MMMIPRMSCRCNSFSQHLRRVTSGGFISTGAYTFQTGVTSRIAPVCNASATTIASSFRLSLFVKRAVYRHEKHAVYQGSEFFSGFPHNSPGSPLPYTSDYFGMNPISPRIEDNIKHHFRKYIADLATCNFTRRRQKK